MDLQRVKPHAKHFYPRPPRGGRLRSHKRYPCPEQNFYPRPPRGGRPPAGVLARWSIRFLSTPSARRATADMAESMLAEQFLSTPSARRATTIPAAGFAGRRISIHALREEGDYGRRCYFGRQQNFYPRPPRGGRRSPDFVTLADKRFLSTPSARRATAKTETKSLFSNKLYNILHEFRRALIYNGSKNYPNHAK